MTDVLKGKGKLYAAAAANKAHDNLGLSFIAEAPVMTPSGIDTSVFLGAASKFGADTTNLALRALLGLKAAFMTPNGVDFFFLFFSSLL